MSTRAAEIAPADKCSDYEFMGPATKAIQDDDSSNPGMFWVMDGEALWNRKEGVGQKILCRLPCERPRQHAGSGCAISGV